MRTIIADPDSHVLIALAAASYITRDVGAGAIAQTLGPPAEPIEVDSALDRLATRALVIDVGRGRWRLTAQGWEILNRRHAGACWETEVEDR